MSAIEPQFLMVLPDDAARVGLVAACVLALVRYATAREDPHNDRLLIDGHVWWRASSEEIGKSLGGLNRYAVRRVVNPLVEDGELATLTPGIANGDRTKAYRVASDLPKCESATRPTCQCAGSQQPGANSHQPWCEFALSIPSREEREGEKGGAAAPPLPPPPITCRKHPDGPDHPEKCHQCQLVREDADRRQREAEDRDHQARAAIRAAIDNCTNDCDASGKLDDQTDCPEHLNFRVYQPDPS